MSNNIDSVSEENLPNAAKFLALDESINSDCAGMLDESSDSDDIGILKERNSNAETDEVVNIFNNSCIEVLEESNNSSKSSVDEVPNSHSPNSISSSRSETSRISSTCVKKKEINKLQESKSY